MDKTYDSKQAERELYSLWEKDGYFNANPEGSQKPYGILMPPPNLTGELHLGHAMQHSILDAIARFKRMQGFDVLLLPGVDHAGIQFEGTFNRILAKEGLSKEKLGREEWLRRAWAFKEQVYNSVSSTWRFMGLSADWSREVFTLEPKVQKAVFEEFKTFWEQDLLYKGPYIVQWCPNCGTAIEDVEMEYEGREEELYYVKYRIAKHHTSTRPTRDEYIIIATARPETIFADMAIAVHPESGYSKYADKMAEKPLAPSDKIVDIDIPILTDDRVDKNFGTGALKITPGHDPLDYKIGKDHGVRNFEILHAIDKIGRMTELAGDLTGLPILKARERAVAKLREMGAIERVEDYTHSVPVCERCKTTVEPLISEEWFVKMDPLAKRALQRIGEINFFPKNYKKILSDWMRKIHDWSISRSLWWGHRIPVWYCQNCNPHHEVGKDKDMVISPEEPQTTCQTCKEKHWVQDEQVLDTWFSSGLWPMSTLGWPDETKELKKYYPWKFELSAPEIKYLWIARMIMLGLWFKKDIPFRNMFFHGMLRDLQGRKFSKSLGNGIDPNVLREEWGTDATRMALYTYSIPGRDGRASKETMNERAKNYRNFANKLWNIARFVLSNETGSQKSKVKSQNKDDEWIKKELEKTIDDVTKNLETFRLHLAVESLYDFIWRCFANIYLEKTKNRRNEAQPTLLYILENCLILLHPFMPFITEKIWQESRGKASGREKLFSSPVLIKAKWPKN